MQWHWDLPPYSAAVFQGFTEVSPYNEFWACLCFLKALTRQDPACCPAHWSADNATVCDFKINKKWFKAICQIAASPSSQRGTHCISFWSSLHLRPDQSSYNVQQNFCESLLWYLWILNHCNVQSIQNTYQYKQIYTLLIITHTHVFRTALNIYISLGAAPFFRSTIVPSLAFPSHFRLSQCYNFCGQNTVSPEIIYCVRTSCTTSAAAYCRSGWHWSLLVLESDTSLLHQCSLQQMNF